MAISVFFTLGDECRSAVIYTLNDAGMEENPCAVRLVDKS
jgi:hypothetical protein